MNAFFRTRYWTLLTFALAALVPAAILTLLLALGRAAPTPEQRKGAPAVSDASADSPAPKAPFELLPRARKFQRWVLHGSLASLAVGLTCLYFSRKHGNWAAHTFSLILVTACLLIVAVVVWNQLFFLYRRTTGYQQNIFRNPVAWAFTPLYGETQRTFIRHWAYAAIAVALLWLFDLFRNRTRSIEARSFPWRLIFFQAALAVLFALTEHSVRLTDAYAGYRIYAGDLHLFDSAPHLLRTYVSKMPQMGIYNSHYPPGVLLTFLLVADLGPPILLKLLLVLISAATVFPLGWLARELDLSPRATALAQALYATSAGVLIYPTLGPVSAMTFPATLSAFLYIRALRTGRLTTAALFGLVFALYFFFSFASHMIALTLAAMTLLALFHRPATGASDSHWEGEAPAERSRQMRDGSAEASPSQVSVITWRRTTLLLATSIATFSFAFLLLHLLTGFDILDCFRTASAQHAIRPGHGYDNPWRYLFRSTGGIFAYFISTGFALSALFFASLPKRGQVHFLAPSPWPRRFTLALLIGLLLSAFSGMSFLETERIWLFFTPLVAISAATELHRREQQAASPHWFITAIFALMLSFACLFELAFQHHMLYNRKPSEMQSRSWRH